MHEKSGRYLAGYDVIVLAAGASKRFPLGNKLMASYRGAPLISHILGTIARLGIGRRIIVTGEPYRDDLLAVLEHYPGWREAFNPRASEGMGTSIAAGAACLARSKGVFICPGDMPDISPADFHDVARHFTGSQSISRPSFHGLPGHPVLFGSALYNQLRRLEGSAGASKWMQSLPSSIANYEAYNARVVRDLDRPEHFL